MRGELRAGQIHTRQGLRGLFKDLIHILEIICALKCPKIESTSDVIIYAFWKDNLTAA